MLLIDGVKYNEWADLRETEDLEPMIQEHAKDIFGENALYIDRKQKLRSLAGTGSIPDAYVISLGGNSPHWHIVEIELSYKDPGRHLVTQINDFINGMKNSRNEIVSAINQWIKSDNIRTLEFKRRSQCEDVHEFLSDLIKKGPVLTIIIEKNTEKLKEAIQIFEERYKTEIVEFRTFRREGAEAVHAHLFEPLFRTTITETTTEVRNLPDGTREWLEDGMVWVREGTYDHKSEADNIASELQVQGYKTDVCWVRKGWRTDPYWKDAKNYVVYRTKDKAAKFGDVSDPAGRAITTKQQIIHTPPGNCVEIILKRWQMKYPFISIPARKDLFPDSETKLTLETDIGAIEAHFIPKYHRVALSKWFKAHPELRAGDRLLITVIEPMKKYRLEIVK
jgi:hypothetical protein